MKTYLGNMSAMSTRNRWDRIMPRREAAAGGGSGPAQTLLDYEAYWRFEETAGTRFDQSTNDYDLTPSDANVSFMPGIASGTAVNSPTGQTKKWLNLAGDLVSLAPGSDAFEVAGWIWVHVGGQDPYFFGKSTDLPAWRGYGNWSLTTAGGRNIAWSMCGNGTDRYIIYGPDDEFQNATWNFVQWSWEGPSAGYTMSVTVNRGTPTTAAFNEASVYDPATEFEFLTQQYGTNDWMEGGLDAFGWWRRLLTTAEADYLYNSGAGIQL